MPSTNAGPAIEHWRAAWGYGWLFGSAVIFSFVASLLSLTLPLFMLLVYDRVLNSRSEATLVALMILAITMIVGMGIFDYARRRMFARFAAKLQAALEERVICLHKRQGADGVDPALGLSELDNLRGFLHSHNLINLIDAVWAPLFVGAVFLINPLLGWLCVSGLLIAALLHFAGRALNSHRRREVTVATRSAKRQFDVLRRATRTVGVNKQTSALIRGFIDSREYSRNVALFSHDRSVAFSVALSTLRSIVAIAALGLGATLVIERQITIGGMVASVVLINRVFFPFTAALRSGPALSAALADWHKIGTSIESSSPRGGGDLSEVSGAPLFELRSVFICPDNCEEPVLANVSLKIFEGEVIQIIGPSGSGKSLLCETLVWRRRPHRGLILGLGRRFSSLSPEQLGSMIGYVPEVQSFLPGTIAANISGIETGDHDPRLDEATLLVGLHDRIASLPDGYRTVIDELGAPLCRGDRELVGLASAIYGRPRVLIIDNPSDTTLESVGKLGAPALTEFLLGGGSLVVLARSPLQFSVPVRNFLIIDGQLISANNKGNALQNFQTVQCYSKETA
jgi:ABC-type protease/lipase transport system fused ATPase/permease subunit